MRYVALLASSRSYGHTRALLDFVTAGRTVEFLDINDFKIAPYSYTHRYENDGFLTILDRILAAEVIIFATPVYWYTMSGQLKIFFDRLTDLVRQHRELRGELVGKLCFAVATSESRTLPPGFEVPFEMTCHYRGQRVEVTLFDSALAGLVNVTQAALVTGCEPSRWGNAHTTIVPYQTFEAADRPFVVAVGNDAQWRKLCDAVDAPGLLADARLATNPGRVEHRAVVADALGAIFRARPAAEWLEVLERAGVPCAPVQGVREALRDRVLTERGGTWPMAGETYGEVHTVASPFRFSRTPASLRHPAPALGEHTGEVARDGWG